MQAIEPARYTAVESVLINYAKAIGIIAVVMGHFPGDPFNFYRSYMYHMPLFFFLGGMLVNPMKSFGLHLTGIAKRHLLYIVIIYVLIALLMHGVAQFYPLRYTNLWKGDIWASLYYPLQRNFHGGSFFPVAWFLFAYAIVAAVGYGLIKIINRFPGDNLYRFALAAGLGICCGYFGMVNVADAFHADNARFYLNTASQVLVGLEFFFFGYAIRLIGFRIINLWGFVLSFFALYVMIKYELGSNVVMSWSKYPKGFVLHTIQALIGIYGVLFFSKILALSGQPKALELIGIQSKTIMSFHILVFVALDIVFFELGQWGIFKTSSFSHFKAPYSWPIYMIAGVFIPLALGMVWDKVWPKLSRLKMPDSMMARTIPVEAT